MTIKILGERSFLAAHLPYERIASPNKYIYDCQALRDLLDGCSVLINCAGLTSGPTKNGLNNVDFCEETPENMLFTAKTNTILPIELASACHSLGVKLIHISSGCIFRGRSPNTSEGKRFAHLGTPMQFVQYYTIDNGWKEADFCNPGSFYAKCKAAADFVLADLPRVCIVRLRMPISIIPSPRNLLTKITKFPRVVHSLNSISPLAEVARAIEWIIEKNKTGIYNVASPSPVFHSQLLDEYAKHNKDYPGYENIDEEELQTLVSAPRSNCILDVSKIQNEGFVFEDSMKIIERTVAEFAANEKKTGV
jgi:dTDP-4-dehydrorhamnose reductase